MPAIDRNERNHILIEVASGGYVVIAWTQSLEDAEVWEWTTSVFTDSIALSEYIKRVAEALEGSGDPVDLKKLTKRRGE